MARWAGLFRSRSFDENRFKDYTKKAKKQHLKTEYECYNQGKIMCLSVMLVQL